MKASRLVALALVAGEAAAVADPGGGQPALREAPRGTYTVSNGRRGPIVENGATIASCGDEGNKALAMFTTVLIEYRPGFCRINGELWDRCWDSGRGVVALRDDLPNLRLSFWRSGPGAAIVAVGYQNKTNECADGLVLSGTWLKAARD